MDIAPIETLDAVSAAAVPAQTTRRLDGWILRHTEGLPMKRANSVYPRGAIEGDLDAAISVCEEFYGELGRSTRFQVSPASRPAGIRDRLLERGYRAHSATAVNICDLGDAGESKPSGAMTVELTPSATDAWWSTALATLELAADERSAKEHLYERIATETAFVRVVRDGVSAGVGMGVISGDWLGIFDIATIAEQRRQGIGALVVDALRQWALGGGARRGYLQVETVNEVAISLYRRAGFRARAYTYEYLTKDARPKRSGSSSEP